MVPSHHYVLKMSACVSERDGDRTVHWKESYSVNIVNLQINEKNRTSANKISKANITIPY